MKCETCTKYDDCRNWVRSEMAMLGVPGKGREQDGH